MWLQKRGILRLIPLLSLFLIFCIYLKKDIILVKITTTIAKHITAIPPDLLF
jgi:hypothetical protein